MFFCFVCKVVNRHIYAYIYRLHMHLLSLGIVYVAHKYLFGAPMFLFACLFGAAYMEMHVLLHINVFPNKESCFQLCTVKQPKSISPRLIYPCNNC